MYTSCAFTDVTEQVSVKKTLMSLAPTMNPETDLAALVQRERVIGKSYRVMVANLKDIHDNRRWKAAGYTSFKDYMEQRECWRGMGGSTTAWASQALHWLDRVEYLEARGLSYPQLQLTDTIALRPLEEKPEEYIAALDEYLAEKKAQGGKKKKDQRKASTILNEKVKAQQHILGLQDSHKCTKQDAVQLARIPDSRYAGNMLSKQPADPQDADSWVALCESDRKLPSHYSLLQQFKGDKLKNVMDKLAALKNKWEQERVLEDKQRLLEAERIDLQKQLDSVKGAATPAPGPEPSTASVEPEPASATAEPSVEPEPASEPVSEEPVAGEKKPDLVEVSFIVNCKMERSLYELIEVDGCRLTLNFDTRYGQCEIKGVPSDFEIEEKTT